MSDPHDENADGSGLFSQIKRVPTLISRLIRDEIASAKAELAEKAKAAGLGAGLAAGGAILALFALGTLINAAVLGLSRFLPSWLAATVVGVILAVIAAVLIVAGVGKLKQGVPPLPTDTIASVKEDIHAVKGTNK